MPSVNLPNKPESAVSARRFIRDNATLDSMRYTEADLLVSELVTNVIQHAAQTDEFELIVDDADIAGMRVTVSHPSAGPIDGAPPGIGFTLIDRMSRTWGNSFEGGQLNVWFTLRTPGVKTVSPELDDSELFRLIAEDPSFSDELLRRHSDLASAIARRYRRKGIDDEDLEQVANMALLKAIQRFDESVGTLRPFAAVTISGELKKLLRDKGWAVRVPRSLQERALLVNRTATELTQALERSPTPEELAEKLDLTEAEVVEAIGASQAYSSNSMDRPSEDTGLTLLDRLESDDPGMLNLEERIAVEYAIAQLPHRQQHILHLRFNEDMTQSEIAEILDISQMHVSRLLSASIEELRQHLSDGEAQDEIA